jgi:hypothetical protein
MVITLGFDPKRNRYVGTWIGSMMNHLWVYDGELDANKRVLTLNAEGPSFSGDGTMAKYQDIIEFVGPITASCARRCRARTASGRSSWKRITGGPRDEGDRLDSLGAAAERRGHERARGGDADARDAAHQHEAGTTRCGVSGTWRSSKAS